MITRRIEPRSGYPGLLGIDLGDGRELVCMAWGDEAEAALAARMEEMGDVLASVERLEHN